MTFTQKIYYNNKPLILTTDSIEYIKNNKEAKTYLAYTEASLQNFRLAIAHLDEVGTLGAVIEGKSEASLKEVLNSLYEPIDAGGGVVLNEKNEVLMIYRRGKWDLPKGKRDEGEAIDVCALREVTEETGLANLKLDEKICDTYHVYSQFGQNLLKHTTWFKMHASSTEKLVPQEEENIQEARWIAPNNLEPIVSKSFEAIRHVLESAGLKW